MPDKRGRPPKTIDDLPKDWREIMIDNGERGGSIAEAQLDLGLCKSTWYALLKNEPEFAEVEEMRLKHSEAWFHRQGRRMIQGGDGNNGVWYANMKNRFGWRDRVDHTSNNRTVKTFSDMYSHQSRHDECEDDQADDGAES